MGMNLTIYYPAMAGSEKGSSPYSYDLKKHIPDKDAAKITEDIIKGPFNRTFGGLDAAEAPLPIDDKHGPYPVAVFIHGTAAWGDAQMEYQEHWATRGFVVVAADYPGITLKDLIGATELHFPPRTDQAGDTRKIVAALTSLTDDGLHFLQ